MRKIQLFLVLFVFLSMSTVQAMTITVGQSVKLKTKNAAGVPLHRIAKSSMFYRLPDGSIVKVIDKAGDNWLKVSSSNNPSGWIVKKYVDEIVNSTSNVSLPEVSSDNETEIWRDFTSCDSQVKTGSKLQKQKKSIRVVTWNIRFFPQGSLYGNDPEDYTDQSWLACTLAWLNPDLVAVQEILDTQEARNALDNVLDGLYGYTGDDWKVDLQKCGSNSSQHVGFIYNASRIKLSDTKDMWEFNGKSENTGDACEGRLRPGRYSYAQSKTTNGFDFHIIAVHTDSGKKESDYSHRMNVIKRLKNVTDTLSLMDQDIIIIGDFNTMGTDTISMSTELEQFKNLVSDSGYNDILITPQCTEYYNGHGGWLDHVIVTKTTQELTNVKATVQGYCNMANCEMLSAMPAAYKHLSDHCPIVIDFVDQDID